MFEITVRPRRITFGRDKQIFLYERPTGRSDYFEGSVHNIRIGVLYFRFFIINHTIAFLVWSFNNSQYKHLIYVDYAPKESPDMLRNKGLLALKRRVFDNNITKEKKTKFMKTKERFANVLHAKIIPLCYACK